MLLALHVHFWKVHGKGIIHFVELKVFFYQKCHQFWFSVLVDLSRGRILPLEISCLFCVRISIVLDCFEHLRTQLGSQRSEGSFLLQIWNDNVFQILHLWLILINLNPVITQLNKDNNSLISSYLAYQTMELVVFVLTLFWNNQPTWNLWAWSTTRGPVSTWVYSWRQ